MNIQVNKHQLERVVIKWLNKHYGDLIPKKYKYYPNSVFYVNPSNEVMIEYNKKNERVYISEIWTMIESLFHLDDNDIQKIIPVWMKETYKLEGVTSVFRSGIYTIGDMENDGRGLQI